MLKKLAKYISTHYLKSPLVFCIDVATSGLASYLSVLLARYIFFPGGVLTSPMGALWVGTSLLVSIVISLVYKTHKSIIRHASLQSIGRLALASLTKGLILAAFALHYFTVASTPSVKLSHLYISVLFDTMLTFCAVVLSRIVMILAYEIFKCRYVYHEGRTRLLIYGVGEKSVANVKRFASSRHTQVIGFLVSEDHRQGITIDGLPVLRFSGQSSLQELKERYSFEAVLFSSEKDVKAEQSRLIDYCINSGIKTLLAPAIDEMVSGRPSKSDIREVKVEDLLGRDEIHISVDEIRRNAEDRVILVTGAAGSIGSELCRQLAHFGVRQLILFDNAETPMHNLRLELEENFPDLDFVPVVGDVRLTARLDFVFRKYRPQCVFHAAAYKHVPLMEENPCEAVLVNVAGTRNVADKCIEYGAEKMVMVSTDKAVNPTNVMGATKRLAEIYVQSLGLAESAGTVQGHTAFVTTRFGNVLGSNGSVIPRFREQIAHGGPVTVTHPDITRFFMTIPEACRLVMEAACFSTGNEIFVFDMGQSVKISYLAQRMIELSGQVPGRDIDIIYTGLRPGEKLYEEVLATEENTTPTSHERIKIAKVREYDYSDALSAVDRLETLSREVKVEDMIRLMKQIIPEYKSKNSVFERLDK